MSLALALGSKSLVLALAFDCQSLALALASEVVLEAGCENSWKAIQQEADFQILHHLLEKIFCSPATSAPVERVFSHSGLFMRPHRARMGDRMLSYLVFLKCNKHV